MAPLSAEQQKLREHKITGSLFPIICEGNPEKLNRLFEELVGLREPEDLSDVWPVQLGSYLEKFVLDFHQNKTGHKLTERGRVVDHPTYPGTSVTLDAYREHDDCVLDVKVTGHYRKIEDILSYYTPQMVGQKDCRQCSRAALLIVHGGAEPVEYDIYTNPAYEKEVWDRVLDFQAHVQSMTHPHPVQPIAPPPEQFRSIDLEKDSPNWSADMIEALITWSKTKDLADEHHEMIAAIKTLLPIDVGKVKWREMSIKRNRRGAVSITRSDA